MDSISVFLADDNLLVREGVRALVSREPDLEVVGVAGENKTGQLIHRFIGGR